MPQLIPAIHVFAGSTRTSVKPKFLRLLEGNASKFAIVEFREDTPASVMRNQFLQLIGDWWNKCSRVAAALPLRLIAEAECAPQILQAVMAAASTREVRSVPLVLQIFTTKFRDDASDFGRWKPLLAECQRSGCFQAVHAFLLALEFKGISLASRSSSLMAFLIALFAMTYVREEADVPWFHETWRVGHGAWAVSAQSVLAPDLRRMAEHLVDSDIFGNLSPIFSPQIARGIRESCHYQVPLNRLVELPVDATNPAATRQFYLNERLSALLVRLGHVSNSLEQLRAQFDALAAGAQPIIKEALEDIAIEIARLAANPPILPRDLTPSPRHPLEEVFSVHRRQLTTEIPRATKPLFDFFPIPIPLYFQDIAATTLQSGLQDLRRFAITALAARIGEHVRDTAITNHYGWLKPSLNPERTWALIAAAFGSDGPTSATRSFIHVPELLQRDFLEEVSGMPQTIGFSQFIALNP